MDTVRWWLHIRNKTIVDHQRCITRIMSTAVGKRQRTMYKSYKTYRGQMMGIFQSTTTHFKPSAAGWFSRKLELEKIGRCCTNPRWWLITSGISRNLQAATALRFGCPGVSFWKLPKTFWTRKVRNKIYNVEQQKKSFSIISNDETCQTLHTKEIYFTGLQEKLQRMDRNESIEKNSFRARKLCVRFQTLAPSCTAYVVHY